MGDVGIVCVEINYTVIVFTDTFLKNDKNEIERKRKKICEITFKKDMKNDIQNDLKIRGVNILEEITINDEDIIYIGIFNTEVWKDFKKYIDDYESILLPDDPSSIYTTNVDELIQNEEKEYGIKLLSNQLILIGKIVPTFGLIALLNS